LHTSFVAILKPGVSPERILKLLHPTPALGGLPKQRAIDFIREHEPFDRGLYAAPFGIITRDYVDALVCIRSCLINQRQVHIFGGAGIVAGSTSESEWLETDRKMHTYEGLQ
jgi:menaquinone-specific isochorismate synthase